jgi:hypothetical protein
MCGRYAGDVAGLMRRCGHIGSVDAVDGECVRDEMAVDEG